MQAWICTASMSPCLFMRMRSSGRWMASCHASTRGSPSGAPTGRCACFAALADAHCTRYLLCGLHVVTHISAELCRSAECICTVRRDSLTLPDQADPTCKSAADAGLLLCRSATIQSCFSRLSRMISTSHAAVTTSTRCARLSAAHPAQRLRLHAPALACCRCQWRMQLPMLSAASLSQRAAGFGMLTPEPWLRPFLWL